MSISGQELIKKAGRGARKGGLISLEAKGRGTVGAPHGCEQRRPFAWQGLVSRRRFAASSGKLGIFPGLISSPLDFGTIRASSLASGSQRSSGKVLKTKPFSNVSVARFP